MKMNYSYNEMKRAFECGRNFQLTGEDNFNELIEDISKASNTVSVCDNCEPVASFYLGTACAKCKKPFRVVKGSNLK
jgi:hypothetical protein